MNDIEKDQVANEEATTKNADAAAKNTEQPVALKPVLTEAEVREQITRSLSKGRIVLETPIKNAKAAEGETTELHYDFNKITGWDYIDAMDADLKSQNSFKISAKQAFELFLRGARRCNPGLDERDLRDRMGWADVLAATRVALVFFVSKSRSAEARTRND